MPTWRDIPHEIIAEGAFVSKEMTILGRGIWTVLNNLEHLGDRFNEMERKMADNFDAQNAAIQGISDDIAGLSTVVGEAVDAISGANGDQAIIDANTAKLTDAKAALDAATAALSAAVTPAAPVDPTPEPDPVVAPPVVPDPSTDPTVVPDPSVPTPVDPTVTSV